MATPVDPKRTPPTQRPVPTVDRCICHDIPFVEILAWAATRETTDLQDIEDEHGCGGSCGMCRPYLKRVLRTGNSRIPLMLDTD
jgi:bacterioferritin-associated ferredoxin